jgi:hypothetical protein
MRACIIIEEADVRYITNCGMMMQLKISSEAMSRGYGVLDTLRYQTFQDSGFDKVRNDSFRGEDDYKTVVARAGG